MSSPSYHVCECVAVSRKLRNILDEDLIEVAARDQSFHIFNIPVVAIFS